MLQLQFNDKSKLPVWLVAPSYTIGSGPDDTVKISDPNLGASQAVIRIESDHLVLEKSEQTNHVIQHEGQPVAARAKVRAGESFSIGSYLFKVVDSQQLRASESEASHQPTSQRGFRIKSLSAALQFRETVVTDELLIGRAEECGLALNTSHLSRRHAKLFVEGDELYIEDLKSSNGTYVNGKKIAKVTRLVEDDELRFDTLKFKVLEGAHAQQKVSAVASSDDINKTVMRPVLPSQMTSSAAAKGRALKKHGSASAAQNSSRAVQQSSTVEPTTASRQLDTQTDEPASSKTWLVVGVVLIVAAAAALIFLNTQQ